MLADRCDVADNFLTRGLGLIPRSRLGAGEGLLLTKTGSITMWFMRFAIDAVFMDRDRRVAGGARFEADAFVAVAAFRAVHVLDVDLDMGEPLLEPAQHQ